MRVYENLFFEAKAKGIFFIFREIFCLVYTVKIMVPVKKYDRNYSEDSENSFCGFVSV